MFLERSQQIYRGCNRDVSSLSNHSTTNLTEGDNQYFIRLEQEDQYQLQTLVEMDRYHMTVLLVLLLMLDLQRLKQNTHFSGGTGVGITDGVVSIGQSVSTTDDVSFGTVTADLTGDVTGDVTGTVSSLSNHSTTNLTEGDNQYFTQARARGSVSVTDSSGDGSLSYDSSSGVITYVGPTASETRAHFSGGTGVGITDGVVSIGQV